MSDGGPRTPSDEDLLALAEITRLLEAGRLHQRNAQTRGAERALAERVRAQEEGRAARVRATGFHPLRSGPRIIPP